MAITKISLNDKNYTLPDADGYIPVGEKASVGNPASPVYMINGKLKPVTSFSGNAYTATKVKGENTEEGLLYLTGVTDTEKGNKDLKISADLSVTSAGQNLAFLNIGRKSQGLGGLRLWNRKHFASIFSDSLTEDREYILPNKDGEFAIISEGNDLVEFRAGQEDILPGKVVQEVGDGTLKIASERLARGCEIVSDTYSLVIGKDDTANLPIALTGRVLAYPDKDASTFEIGAPVCAGENGTVSQMTEEEERMYPSRILGTVSEIPSYEVWSEGNKNVPVNGRIWIRVR